jgi:hypothetical protein
MVVGLSSGVFRTVVNDSIRPWWWGALTTFAYLWTAFTAIVMLLTSWFAVHESDFNLGLGLLQVRGRAALWVTLPVGLCGIAAIVLLLLRRSVGGKLLVLYSLFFVVCVGSDLTKELLAVGRARKTPDDWPTVELALLVLVAGFLVSALWGWSRAFSRAEQHQ